MRPAPGDRAVLRLALEPARPGAAGRALAVP